MKLSVVIPCYNEETVINSTLLALQKYLPASFSTEVVLVDNGSTDRSIEIAEQYSLSIIKDNSGTVSGVRNVGVSHSKGDMLVFIDADVEVTEAWGLELEQALNSLRKLDVLGSHCSVPPSENALFKYWFKAIEVNSSSHIGTGHMIVHRTVFDELGGFDETLATGEDYNFCARIKAIGGRVIENEKLVVYHNGYPDTVVEYFKRELWHGVGDWRALRSVWRSKVLMLAIIYMSTLIFALCMIFIDPKVSLLVLLAIQLFVGFIAMVKFGIFDGFKGLLVRTALFNVYFVARFFSFLSAFKSFRKEM